MPIRFIRLTAAPVRRAAQALARRHPGGDAELWLHFAGFDVEAFRERRGQQAPVESRPASGRAHAA